MQQSRMIVKVVARSGGGACLYFRVRSSTIPKSTGKSRSRGVPWECWFFCVVDGGDSVDVCWVGGVASKLVIEAMFRT